MISRISLTMLVQDPIQDGTLVQTHGQISGQLSILLFQGRLLLQDLIVLTQTTLSPDVVEHLMDLEMDHRDQLLSLTTIAIKQPSPILEAYKLIQFLKNYDF